MFFNRLLSGWRIPLKALSISCSARTLCCFLPNGYLCFHSPLRLAKSLRLSQYSTQQMLACYFYLFPYLVTLLYIFLFFLSIGFLKFFKIFFDLFFSLSLPCKYIIHPQVWNCNTPKTLSLFCTKNGIRRLKSLCKFSIDKTLDPVLMRNLARRRSRTPAGAPLKIKNGEPFGSPSTTFYHSVLLLLGYLSAQSLGQCSPTIFSCCVAVFLRCPPASSSATATSLFYTLSVGGVRMFYLQRDIPDFALLGK